MPKPASTSSVPVAGQGRPVTSSFRATWRLLRSTGGFRAIFRGLPCFIAQAAVTALINGITYTVIPYSFVLSNLIGSVRAQHADCNVLMLGYGRKSQARGFINASEAAGLRTRLVTCKKEFIGAIPAIKGAAVILIFQEQLSPEIGRALSALCDRAESLYILRTHSEVHLDEQTKEISTRTEYDASAVSEAASAIRTAEATKKALRIDDLNIPMQTNDEAESIAQEADDRS